MDNIQASGGTPTTEELIAAPERFLDLTITEMHSIPDATLQEIHLRALHNQFAAMVSGSPRTRASAGSTRSPMPGRC
jgi:hypothetical protein